MIARINRRGKEAFGWNLTTPQIHEQCKAEKAKERQVIGHLQSKGLLNRQSYPPEQAEKAFMLVNQIKSYLLEIENYCPNMNAVLAARTAIENGTHRDLLLFKVMALRALANARSWGTKQGIYTRAMLNGLLRFID